jgi:hypothetical protein
MARFKFHCGIALGILLFTVFCAQNLHAEPRPHQLRFAVYRNGKLAGKAEVNMQRQGERWIIRSEGSGTRGLGRLLRVADTEQVEGYFLDGKFRPEYFSHHSRLAGIDNDWSAQFNWQNDSVTITKDDAVLSLNMGAGALDTLSLKLELQRRLRNQDPDLQFFLVDDDRIKPQTYRVLAPQQLETSLGCLATLPVELVPTATGKTRYSRSWHAPEFDFLTVRLDRLKTNGVHLEMRLTGMVLDGKEIGPLPPCAVKPGDSGKP